jgi:hypothetical protein
MALYFDDQDYKGDYASSIIKFLEGAIESWELERETDYSYEATSSNPDNAFEKITRLADTLMQATDEPGNTTAISNLMTDQEVKSFFSNEEAFGHIYGHIEKNMAKQAVGLIAKGSFRFWGLYHLLLFLGEHKVSPFAAKFLKRVTRCYLWGFDSECIILCRGAIEQAINDYITYEMCQEVLGSPYPGGYGLSARITVGKRKGIFSQSLVDLIRVIKERGDKTIHHDLHITKDIIGTIRDTFLIIATISSNESS